MFTTYFNGNDGGDENKTITDTGQYEQNLLWSNNLIDATYKTTKYDLALFFIGYSVVAEFVVQSETSENIREALLKLKEWNPTSYFMTDYSEAELMALEQVFHNYCVLV